MKVSIRVLRSLTCVCIEQFEKYREAKEIIEEDKNRIDELTIAEDDYKGCIIKVRKNDITDEPVDAIVNPANEHLTNGAGAAKAIEDGAGAEYRKECDQYLQRHGSLPTGQAMVTSGGNLPCRYVINVVGPCCQKKQEDINKECKQLQSVVKNILRLTLEHDFKSVCILAVSTGLFHFPLKE
jgi:putative ATPase